MDKIKLGDKVKQKLGPFSGIVIAITERLSGHCRIQVQSQEEGQDKGLGYGAVWYDDCELIIVASGVYSIGYNKVDLS